VEGRGRFEPPTCGLRNALRFCILLAGLAYCSVLGFGFACYLGLSVPKLSKILGGALPRFGVTFSGGVAYFSQPDRLPRCLAIGNLGGGGKGSDL